MLGDTGTLSGFFLSALAMHAPSYNKIRGSFFGRVFKNDKPQCFYAEKQQASDAVRGDGLPGTRECGRDWNVQLIAAAL